VNLYLDSPPRRTAQRVSELALRLFNEFSTEFSYSDSLGSVRTVATPAVTAYRLGQAWGEISGAILGVSSVPQQIDVLMKSQEKIIAAVKLYMLECRTLMDSYGEVSNSAVAHRRKVLETFEDEAESLFVQLSLLRPIHSKLQQCFLLLMIDPADYKHMPPRARKNREAVTKQLALARDEVFTELTHHKLESYVEALESTLYSKKYRRFVPPHKLTKVEEKLSELTDSLLVDSLVMFTIED